MELQEYICDQLCYIPRETKDVGEVERKCEMCKVEEYIEQMRKEKDGSRQ